MIIILGTDYTDYADSELCDYTGKKNIRVIRVIRA